ALTHPSLSRGAVAPPDCSQRHRPGSPEGYGPGRKSVGKICRTVPPPPAAAITLTRHRPAAPARGWSGGIAVVEGQCTCRRRTGGACGPRPGSEEVAAGG